jgi:uncharacterized protein YbgA (DUF1722 family)/uncharacterized protein YbbK (DUF523 family)
MQQRLKIGISACVMGRQVRYDASHKKSVFCTEQLAEFAEFVPVCPEVAVGLPVPRPTIRQIRTEDNLIKVSRPDGSGDVTQALTAFGQQTAKDNQDLAGFIVCAKSPTCGMERVKVYHHHGKGSESNGVGLFTQQLMAANPSLPIEENGRLNDPVIRENFITRIFAYQKWLELQGQGVTKHRLFDFHRAHKYLLMSHHVASYRSLGQLIGQSDLPLQPLAEQYITGFMAALSHKATRRTHTNTLQHLQGYFKSQLTSQKRQELSHEIDAYRQGLSPLLVPLTLINHHLREFPNAYLSDQVYLNPHPKELKLRYGY